MTEDSVVGGLIMVTAFTTAVMGLFVGYSRGSNYAHNEAVRTTTVECVTSPKVCKIRYDFYTLKVPKGAL